MVIEKNQMIPFLIDQVPELSSDWRAFKTEWVGRAELPIYLFLSDTVVPHFLSLVGSADTKKTETLSRVVENWHTLGDSYVREAATIGFLESLQNRVEHDKINREVVRNYLGRETQFFWDQVYLFWLGEIRIIPSSMPPDQN